MYTFIYAHIVLCKYTLGNPCQLSAKTERVVNNFSYPKHH